MKAERSGVLVGWGPRHQLRSCFPRQGGTWWGQGGTASRRLSQAFGAFQGHPHCNPVLPLSRGLSCSVETSRHPADWDLGRLEPQKLPKLVPRGYPSPSKLTSGDFAAHFGLGAGGLSQPLRPACPSLPPRLWASPWNPFIYQLIMQPVSHPFLFFFLSAFSEHLLCASCLRHEDTEDHRT